MRPLLLITACCIWITACYPTSAAAAKTPQQEEFRYWNSNWSFEDIDLGTLTERLRSIGVELPVEISGQATVDFVVSIPINALGTAEAYRFRGTLKARDFQTDQAKFDSVEATLAFDQGVLKVIRFVVSQGEGKIIGSGQAELTPRNDFSADVQLKSFDVAPIAQVLKKLGVGNKSRSVSGVFDAKVAVSGKVDQISQPSYWDLSGSADASNVSVGDSMSYEISLPKFELIDQQVSIADLKITSPMLPEFFGKADADFHLDRTGTFHLNVATNDFPASDLLGMVVESPTSVIDGKLDMVGKVAGQFVEGKTIPTFDLQAAIASPEIVVAGVKMGLLEHDVIASDHQIFIEPRSDATAANEIDLTIGSFSTQYDLGESTLAISNLNAEIFGGTLSGSATVARKMDGEHRVEMTWNSVQPSLRFRLFEDAKQVTVSGKTSGRVKWAAPANRLQQPHFHRADATVSLDPVLLAGQQVGGAEVVLSMDGGALDISGDGNLFGGKFSVRTVAPIAPQATWLNVPDQLLGEIRLTDVSVDRVSRRLFPTSSRFGGAADATVKFDRVVDETRIEQSRRGVETLRSVTQLRLRNLSREGTVFAKNLLVDFNSQGQDLESISVRGTYAGGQLQAGGSWALGQGERVLSARLVHADGDRLLIPVSQSAEDWVGGRVTARAKITGAVGDSPFASIRVNGSVDVDKATTFGLPVGDGHSPFTVTVRSNPLRWSAQFPAIQSSLADGRFKGRLEVSSASSSRRGFDLQSNWRMHHVDFERLLETYVGSTTLGRGNVTGNLTLYGQDIRGSRDLRGEYDVVLGGTDATAVPGLASADSLIGATSLASTRFTSGSSRGRIFRGDLIIESLAMASDHVALQSEGRVNLANSRMDVSMVLATGNFQGQELLLEQFGTRALRELLLPLSQVNRLLSDRTVVFRLAGALRDPILRLQPAETLQANLRRYFIQEAIGLFAADSLISN